MRIVHFVHGFRPEFTGGVERYVESLARTQARQHGHDVHIVSGSGRRPSRPSVQDEIVDGIHVLRVLRSDLFLDQWFDAYAPSVERAVRGIIERLAPDLIHVHHWKRLTSNLVQIGAFCSVPAVLTVHDLWGTCPRENRLLGLEACTRRLGAESCERCARLHFFQSIEEVGAQAELFRALVVREIETAGVVLAPTRHHASEVARHLGIGADRFEVLPLGRLSLERLEPAPADERRPPDAPLRVGYWGHLVDFKGPHLLLEALAHVRTPERFDVHVFGTEGAPMYRARLARLAEGRRVTFHGAFCPSDLSAITLDVAVIPSICLESYSFVLEEAFSLGLPVIVSDRGALPERAGAAGLVFRAADARHLAQRLQSLVDDPASHERIRSGVPAEDRSAERHAAALSAVYDRARAEGPRRLRGESEHLALCEQLAADRDRRMRLLIELREKADRAEQFEGNLLRHRDLLRERDHELAAHRKVLEDVRRDLESHRDVLGARERECSELREMAGILKADLDGHRAVLQERERECAERLAVQEHILRDNQALREVLGARERELGEHREALVAARREVEVLRRVVEEQAAGLHALHSQIEEHREALGNRDAEIERFRAEVAEQASRLEELRRTLAQLRQTFAYRFVRALTGGAGQRNPDDGPHGR